MNDDPILAAMKSSRAVAEKTMEHFDRLIKMHEEHLKKFDPISLHPEQPSPQVKPIANLPPAKMLNPGGRRPANPALAKATQETALELLGSGKTHVQTGEVMKATTAKGHRFPENEPTKYAYQYLKNCKLLENFLIDKEKKQLAWRKKELSNTQSQHSAGEAV